MDQQAESKFAGPSHLAGKAKEISVTGNPNHFLYDCSHCGQENLFKPRDPIRCANCGCRVLFKKRTKRMVQFEAR